MKVLQLNKNHIYIGIKDVVLDFDFSVDKFKLFSICKDVIDTNLEDKKSKDFNKDPLEISVIGLCSDNYNHFIVAYSDKSLRVFNNLDGSLVSTFFLNKRPT